MHHSMSIYLFCHHSNGGSLLTGHQTSPGSWPKVTSIPGVHCQWFQSKRLSGSPHRKVCACCSGGVGWKKFLQKSRAFWSSCSDNCVAMSGASWMTIKNPINDHKPPWVHCSYLGRWTQTVMILFFLFTSHSSLTCSLPLFLFALFLQNTLNLNIASLLHTMHGPVVPFPITFYGHLLLFLCNHYAILFPLSHNSAFHLYPS